MKKEVSCGGVVYKKVNGKIKVALIKDAYGRWTFPKGHMEKGETKEETAKRETEEELGLTNLKVERFLGSTHFVFRLKGELIFKTPHSYLLKCPQCGKLKKSWEIQEAKWVNIDKALEMVGYKNTKEILKKAMKILRI